MRNILEYMKDHIIYLDGGMGTLLQAQGLQPGELPERWNITHAEAIISIHQQYFDATKLMDYWMHDNSSLVKEFRRSFKEAHNHIAKRMMTYMID